jgi:predicted GNAT family acetyltransferase
VIQGLKEIRCKEKKRLRKLRIATYDEAGAFLVKAQAALERNEEENHLILGICERMRAHPERVNKQPFLGIIETEGEIVLGVMMTPPFPLVLARVGDIDKRTFSLLADKLLHDDWPVTEINGPEVLSSEFADVWAAETGTHKRIARQQRLYSLSRVQIPLGVNGVLRKATAEDLSVVLAWGEAFTIELHDEMSMDFTQLKRVIHDLISVGNIYLWDDGGPVSMAMQNRPSRNGVAVSYVYTPPPKRRRGYASACVAALSEVLLASNYKFCTLYTDLHDPTTNSIYQAVGYQPVADFTSYTFI